MKRWSAESKAVPFIRPDGSIGSLGLGNPFLSSRCAVADLQLVLLMHLKSFVRDGLGLRSVDLELTLAKGLPGIKFLGLPDHLIKESEVRIQTALRNQGFEIPPAQTLLVQLRPMEGRKTSHGLDLAIAAGFLWLTEQLPLTLETQAMALYGELDFKGFVRTPVDVLDVELVKTFDQLVTAGRPRLSFDHWIVNQLLDLKSPKPRSAQTEQPQWERPSVTGWSVPEALAKILKTVALGEHHVLMAGPPGTGKSTAATLLAGLLREPWEHERLQMEQVARFFGGKLDWRPVRRPHHTASELAIVGGTAAVVPGEVTKAHGGILVLDELLEFDPRVQETLREPLESGTIHLARGSASAEYPARILLVATTNLCSCGQLVPHPKHKCHCTNRRRRSYVERLSGPFLERFSLIGLANEWGAQEAVPIDSIQKEVLEAIQFQKVRQNRKVPNQFLVEEEILPYVDKGAFKRFAAVIPSRRRLINWLRLARTCADLERSEAIGESHLQQAWDLGESAIRKLTVELPKYI